MFFTVALYSFMKHKWNVSERFGKTFQHLYCSVLLTDLFLFVPCVQFLVT